MHLALGMLFLGLPVAKSLNDILLGTIMIKGMATPALNHY
jgi:hypothetical protein